MVDMILIYRISYSSLVYILCAITCQICCWFEGYDYLIIINIIYLESNKYL